MRGIDAVHSLEGNETGGVGGTNTGTTMLHRLVGDGELAQVVTNHFGFDFNLIEGLSAVNTHIGTDHFGDDDHIPEVCLYYGRLLFNGGFHFGLSKTLDQGHGLSLETTLELATGTGSDQVNQLVRGNLEQLLKLNTTIGELFEGTLLFQISRIISLIKKDGCNGHVLD